MALTPQINAPQGATLAAVRQTAVDLRLPQGTSLVAYNIPADFIRSTSGAALVSVLQRANINVYQASILTVDRGSISNPSVRVFTFELDTHEFYVLKLGNDKTLVLDLATEKWSWWSSGSAMEWRANAGTNWTQSGSTGINYGSNVVVGDGTLGILWIMDPDTGYDESTEAVARDAGATIPFQRVATGQVLARGRDFIPCYEVYLTTDAGRPAFVGAEVELLYSDDGGRSYVSAGVIVAQEGEFQQTFAWRSLGQVSAPGRMFRLEDNGAFAIIQELSIADV